MTKRKSYPILLLPSGLTRIVALFPLLTLACDSIPFAPVEIPTVDRTAIFDSLQISLTGINYSWMPKEGPIPSSDTNRVTIEIDALCYARGTCTIDPSEFQYRTWDGHRAYDPGSTTPWRSSLDAREPVLESVTLENGGTARGWLTFLVPVGLSYLPDEFLWQPDPRVTFSFHLPTASASLVCGSVSIFGRVTDPNGIPVPGAPLDLSLRDLSWPSNTFEQGECRGDGSPTHSWTADAEGRFDFRAAFRFCNELCAVLTASGPDGSDAGDATVHAGTVWPSAMHPLVEPSELRIDVMLPGVER